MKQRLWPNIEKTHAISIRQSQK